MGLPPLSLSLFSTYKLSFFDELRTRINFNVPGCSGLSPSSNSPVAFRSNFVFLEDYLLCQYFNSAVPGIGNTIISTEP